MRPRLQGVVEGLYRLVAPTAPKHTLREIAPGVVIPEQVLEDAQRGEAEARRYLARMPIELDLRGRSALDVGCGAGDLCFEIGRHGARRVLGVDISEDNVRLAQTRVEAQPDLAVDIRVYGGSLEELGDERFDFVFSKDSFEHYGAQRSSPSPEEMISGLADRLHDDGLLVIGFGPFWKAPTGGHIRAKLPWAHLLFPEHVVLKEFRRTRPGNTATSFEEASSVNRMTFARFRSILAASGLDCVSCSVNVSDNLVVKVMSVLRRIPALEEYCTQNVYGVWRRPGAPPR